MQPFHGGCTAPFTQENVFLRWDCPLLQFATCQPRKPFAGSKLERRAISLYNGNPKQSISRGSLMLCAYSKCHVQLCSEVQVILVSQLVQHSFLGPILLSPCVVHAI
jgi:hypothetical protein